MPDIVDMAQSRIEQDLANQIAAARGVVPLPGAGRKHCEECGDKLPKARYQMGFSRCVSCVEADELLRRVGAAGRIA